MSKGLTIGLLATVILAGCANSTVPEDAPRPSTMQETKNDCDASHLQSHVGQPHSEALEQTLSHQSQAKRLRVIKPSQGYTMDYRSDRLNIYVDDAGRIKQLSCG